MTGKYVYILTGSNDEFLAGALADSIDEARWKIVHSSGFAEIYERDIGGEFTIKTMIELIKENKMSLNKGKVGKLGSMLFVSDI